MNRRTFYLSRIVVTILAGVLFFLTFTSYILPSRSLLADPPRFGGRPVGVVLLFVLVLAWRLVIRRLHVIYWTRAVAESSLTPAGEGYRSIPIPLVTPIANIWLTAGIHQSDGPLTLPAFTGTVDGVPVRATLGKREYEPENGNRRRSLYTVIEAALEQETHEGAIIASLAHETSDHGNAPFAVENNADIIDEELDLAVAATSQALAEAVLSGDARDALANCTQLEQIYAGDITAVFDTFETASVAGSGREWETKAMLLDAHGESANIDASTAWLGDTASVSHPVAGARLGPEELDAQLQAVAAVAAAFDESRRW